MKTKIIIVSIVFLAAMVAFADSLSRNHLPKGSFVAKDVVSFCTGGVTDDGDIKLFAISGRGGTIDTGERYGEFLLVCDVSAEDDMAMLGYIPSEKIFHQIDLTGIKPLKVQLGDINGDGVKEVALCVYKTAKFHTVMAKRPFFFNLVEGNLIPVWLGSRLSRPFDDYILHDIDNDSIDEIISIELLQNNDRVIAAYDWKGFGFEMFAESDGFDGEMSFYSNIAADEEETKAFYTAFYNHDGYTKLKFDLIDDKLVYMILK